MLSATDDLSLTAGHDEEALLILALLHEELVHIDLLRLEGTDQTLHDFVVELGEQWDGLQVLG